jgi:hypothetical protein
MLLLRVEGHHEITSRKGRRGRKGFLSEDFAGLRGLILEDRFEDPTAARELLWAGEDEDDGTENDPCIPGPMVNVKLLLISHTNSFSVFGACSTTTFDTF